MSNSTRSSLTDDQYLGHILIEISRIKKAMKGKSLVDLENDWELEHKVTRSLEIKGEASSRISSAFKLQNEDIPWKEIKWVRNRIIHEYFEINYDVIFLIVKDELSRLDESIRLLTERNKNTNPLQKRSATSERPLLEKTRTNPNKSKRRKL